MVDKINKLHRVRWKGDTATVEGRPCSELHKDGEGVLVGIIDVQGFDFTHPDFLNPDGRTRWEAIWDQGGTTRPAPKSNRADEGDFAYGSLIRKHHMDAAIKARPRRGWPGSSSRGLGFVGFQHGYRKTGDIAANPDVHARPRLRVERVDDLTLAQ